MAYPSKYNIKTATGKLNKFDLSRNHICTHDFGVIKPIMMQPTVPGDKFDIKVSQFTRLMPLPCPTYGVINSLTRAFYVPYVTVMSNWHEFISNNYSTIGADSLKTPAVPYVEQNELVSSICESEDFVEQYSSDESEMTDGYDVKYMYVDTDATETLYYVKFTWLGRKCVDFLHSLGLNFAWVVDHYSDAYNVKISMLPILCWWKFYLDWIVPARFVNDYSNIKRYIDYPYDTTNNNLSGWSDFSFADLIKPISAYLQDDFFTGAFVSALGDDVDRPYVNNIVNPASFNANNNFGGASDAVVNTTYDGGSHIDNNVTSNQAINAFTMKSLGVLQDMINRGKIAGTRIQDYLFSTYGLRPSDAALKMSSYYGVHKSTIQIGDIQATATTETTDGTTYLGQFAGKGFGGSVDTFHIECKDHGMIFLTNELQVRSSYTQGLHPEWTALDRFGFFQPELDNLGTRAISMRELISDADDLATGLVNVSLGSVFGFTPNYSEHKVAFDTISGDFRINRLNTGLDSWYLNRKFNYSDVEDLYINRTFCESVGSNAGNDYDRIFQVANDESDHFYSVFNLGVMALRPMQTISDALETEETNKMGKETSVEFNGSVNS